MKYTVVKLETIHRTYEIAANSEDEAEEIAKKMARIDCNELDRTMEIVSVIGEEKLTKLKADFDHLTDDAGYLKATVHCWFHEEETPSMLIDSKGYHCLSCGKRDRWPILN
jgi:hypothetical protein|tara:strand:- start:137 stop:469 length:333 start_codon:yes stop_codon:yes gene_type:complete